MCCISVRLLMPLENSAIAMNFNICVGWRNKCIVIIQRNDTYQNHDMCVGDVSRKTMTKSNKLLASCGKYCDHLYR